LAFVVVFVAAASETLAGRTFESGDGDLAPNANDPPAAHNWNNS
jgi:hypothetical protein